MASLFTEKLSDQVYIILRDRIIRNELKPGSRLNFPQLLDELKISKTPLREALHRLHIEGFVDVKPRSGTYVSVPQIKDVIDLYDLRIAIEWQALHLALERIPKQELINLQKEIEIAEDRIKMGDNSYFYQHDTNFHHTIMRHCDNPHIQGTMETIASKMHWFRVSSATSVDRKLNSCLRHRQILKAIVNGDKKLACEVLVLHIEEVKVDVSKSYEDIPSDDING